LENWLKLKPTLMDEWQEDRESLVDLFGRVRDDWIENDLSGWIAANRCLIYGIIGVYFHLV